MWMFTKYGFYSVVCARDEYDALIPDLMMMRSRQRYSLDYIVKRFDLDTEIKQSSDTDYKFRIIISKKDWMAVSCVLCDDINYGNFKDAVGAYHGGHTMYHRALHLVWEVMADLQQHANT